MLQLPLVLFIVMAELSVGAVSVLVFLDWRNEVKRGFLTLYAFIYLVLAGLTFWFQQGFITRPLLNSYARLDKAWTGQLVLPLLLFFLLLIPYGFFLMLDKKAGVDGRAVPTEGEEAVEVRERSTSPLRVLRLLSGLATVVAGLVTIFVLAMMFRAIGGNELGQVLIVASFFASTFALGGAMTAMWLGHWYLVTPALSERPLQFSTTLVLVAVLAQVLFAVLAGPSALFPDQASPSTQSSVVATPTVVATPVPKDQVKPLDAPVVAPLSPTAISWLHILVGFVIPLVLGGLSWKLIRDRSFQSATGMLYLVGVCALAGEIMARGLLLGHL